MQGQYDRKMLTGRSKGWSGMRTKTGGGGSMPPPVVPAGMKLGMNLGGLVTYSGAFPFNNILWNAGPWVKLSGTITYTENQGDLSVTAVTGTATLCLSVCTSGGGLVAGTYTLVNPNGYSLAVGSGQGGSDLSGGFTAANNVPIVIPVDGTVFVTIQVSAIGSYTGFALIQPGRLAAWQGGDHLSQQFKDFYTTLNSPVVRTMDWTMTNMNIEEDWADRSVLGKVHISSWGGYQPTVPWEVVISTANALNRDVWINIPVRATQAYVDSLAALFAANLNASLNVYVETCNEVWNTGALFAHGYAWVTYLNHTKIFATVDAATGIVTKVGHGLTSGNVINGFVHKDTRQKYIFDSGPAGYYLTARGGNCYVEVLTVNTFKVHTNNTLASPITWATGVTNWIYTVPTEAGKSTDLDANYMTLVNRNVAAFDTAMGTTRVQPVIGSHAGGSSRTTARITNLGLGRGKYVAIAPYFIPLWFGVALDISSGQAVPKAWSNAGGSGNFPAITAGVTGVNVDVSVYAAGSAEPTDQNIIDGAGTGYIATSHKAFTQLYGTPSATTYASGATITGLTNGVSYDFWFLITDSRGFKHRLKKTATISATASTVTAQDLYSNQAKRCYTALDLIYSTIQSHLDVIAASAHPELLLLNYEGGMHLDESGPTEINDWMVAFTEDVWFGTVLQYYVNLLSAMDEKLHLVFSDVASKSLSWATADSYGDTVDQRFQAMAGYSGNVTKLSKLALADTNATTVASDPLNFPTPTTVYTFANAAWTYEIVKGNDLGNYQMSGNLLQMINDVGVNWAIPTAYPLVILAKNGSLAELVTITATAGSAWYGGADLFAFNTVVDTNTTQVDPDKGSALPMTAGVAATASGGMWVNTTGAYTSTTGATATAILTGVGSKEFMVACVANKGTAGTFNTAWRVGGSNFIRLVVASGGANASWGTYNGVNGEYVTGPIDATSRVYWFYYDPTTNKVKYGHGTTYMNPSGTAGDTPTNLPASLDRYIELRGHPFQYGSIRVLNETGIDIAAVVASLKSVHGLP